MSRFKLSLAEHIETFCPTAQDQVYRIIRISLKIGKQGISSTENICLLCREWGIYFRALSWTAQGLTELKGHQWVWQWESSLSYSAYTFIFFGFSTLAVISDNLLIFLKETAQMSTIWARPPSSSLPLTSLLPNPPHHQHICVSPCTFCFWKYISNFVCYQCKLAFWSSICWRILQKHNILLPSISVASLASFYIPTHLFFFALSCSPTSNLC